MATAEPKIPQKGLSEPSYAVHRPTSEAGPSSPRPVPSPQTQEHEHDDRPNTPPPYSGPTTSSMSIPQAPAPQLNYPGLPRLEYRLYSPESFTLSADCTTLTSYNPRLSTYPAALVSLIQQLATVPPKPQIRIVGKSGDTIDFDIKLNMMNLFVPDQEKGRMNYVKVIGAGELGFRGDTKETTAPTVTGGLEEWARRFCEDGSSIKQFVFPLSNLSDLYAGFPQLTQKQLRTRTRSNKLGHLLPRRPSPLPPKQHVLPRPRHNHLPSHPFPRHNPQSGQSKPLHLFRHQSLYWDTQIPNY
jgi:hypothetical protein